KKGKLVAENNRPLFDIEHKNNSKVMDTVRIKTIAEENLKIKIDSDTVNIIKVLPHSIITEKVERKVTVENGIFKFNEEEDIVKLAVIERHRATGNIGLGLVENFNLKGGAIASTIAHDSHNLIVIGDNDKDILLAIKEVTQVGGGITIVSKG